MEKGRITKHIYFHKDKIPHKITQTFIYKLTNKFDGSIKYKSKIIEKETKLSESNSKTINYEKFKQYIKDKTKLNNETYTVQLICIFVFQKIMCILCQKVSLIFLVFSLGSESYLTIDLCHLLLCAKFVTENFIFNCN